MANSTKQRERYALPLRPWMALLGIFVVMFITVMTFLTLYPFSVLFSSKCFLTNWFTPGSSGDGTNKHDNKIFSDNGRRMLVLWSLLFAAIGTGLFYFVFMNRM